MFFGSLLASNRYNHLSFDQAAEDANRALLAIQKFETGLAEVEDKFTLTKENVDDKESD